MKLSKIKQKGKKTKATKAQAALEFLMTYGWAILVLTIAIGAIALSGLLSPTTFGKEYCISPPQLECNSIYATSNQFRVKLSNNFGFPIKITSIKGKVGFEEIEKRIDEELKQGESKLISFQIKNSRENTLTPFSLNVSYVPCPEEINPECRELEGIKYNILVEGKVFVNPS